MILADTNFWLALSLSRHVFHTVTRDWLEKQPPAKSLLFCRSTQQSFLRLLCTEAVMRPYGIPPLTNSAAWSVYEDLRSDRRVGWVGEPDHAGGLEARWKKLTAHGTASAKLWMDAYLAALALTGGYQLVTTDKGFKQFEELDSIVLINGATKG